MEAIRTMNIFSELFGIFRQRGLVESFKQGSRLTGFAVAAFLLVILGGALYGFAMGIGLGIETAAKDAIKVALIATLGLLLAIPIFWVAYRLLGHQQRPSHVAAVPMTLAAAVALVLAVTAPIVFMLSILTGNSPYAIYIHVVIINLALLVGLYLAGTLIYHGFPDRKGLVIPNVISFLLMGVILVVLMSFLAPYLAPSRSFSVGTDRLLGGLGIGVEEMVDQALAAAKAADRVSYSFQSTNDNGDLVRDYTVTRVGDDSLLELHTHAISGEKFLSDVRIWELDGKCYVDFDDGRVIQVERSDLLSMLDPALAPAAFSLPGDFEQASWRAYEGGNRYTVTGIDVDQRQAKLILDAGTGRLSEMVLGSALKGLHSETRVKDISTAELDREGLAASLNRATVLGAIDGSDASMQDYVQDETLFVVRFPRTWRALSWSSANQQIDFVAATGAVEGNPRLTVNVYDLAEGKGPRQYAEDLARSLALLAEYRDINTDVITIDDEAVGVVEYLHDRTVKGEIESTRHIEYIYEGQLSRYHLKFAAPETRFESYRQLFAEMARQFTFLRTALWQTS
jgi:hypothetical protein